MTEKKDREALLAAYRATRYVVLDGDREIAARIDARDAGIDALLARTGAESGTFITAWNPRSEAKTRAENDQANREMAAALAAAGRRWLPHVGRGEGSGWAEQGFFVLDLPEPAAIELAERFGQNAVMQVERGQPARLLLSDLMPR